MTVQLDGGLALHRAVNGSWWILDRRGDHLIGPYPTEFAARRFAKFLNHERRNHEYAARRRSS